MPNGGFELVVMIVVTWVCVKYKNIRSYSIIFTNIIALAGSIMVFTISLDNKAAVLAGYYMVSSIPCSYFRNLINFSSSLHGLPDMRFH
jgi:hypothetical protein